MTRIGIIGIGFMGYTHFTAAAHLPNARVAAIATRNEKKRQGDWTGIQGNFGPPAGKVDLSDVKAYADYRELLADPDIDLVDICLPTDQHEKVVLESLAAGKHTLVEKPIAIDAAAASRMVEAATAAGKMLMVAHVLPFFPEFHYACDVVSSGQYGRLQAGHFRRVISPPDWSDDMADFRKLGGWGVDLHIHDNHLILNLCGKPQAVFSTGLLQNDLVNHVHTQYVYPGGPAISCVSGGIAASGLQFAHGFELYLEQATVVYSAGTVGGEWVVDRPLSLITADGNVTSPNLPGGSEWYSAFQVELETAVKAVESGQESAVLSGTMARDALAVCLAEAESISSGSLVSLD